MRHYPVDYFDSSCLQFNPSKPGSLARWMDQCLFLWEGDCMCIVFLCGCFWALISDIQKGLFSGARNILSFYTTPFSFKAVHREGTPLTF